MGIKEIFPTGSNIPPEGAGFILFTYVNNHVYTYKVIKSFRHKGLARLFKENNIWPPLHPGGILKEDVLPALRISISEVARQLGVSRQTLHRIMAETHSVTPEMVLRLGKFCGNGPGLWLRLQQKYDLWHAKKRLRSEIDKIPDHTMAVRQATR